MGLSKLFEKGGINLKLVSGKNTVLIRLDETKELSDFLQAYHNNNLTESGSEKGFTWNITTLE